MHGLSYRHLALLLAVVALGPQTLRGQPADSLFDQGVLAFEEARYEDAAHLLRRAVRTDRRNAEAQYWLARLYAETPLHNPFRAREALKSALALAPDTLRYLDLRLRTYRQDSTNIAAYAERLATRKRLAEAILRQDPHHALALTELGRAALDDYAWRIYGVQQFRNKNHFARKRDEAFDRADASLQRAVEAAPAEAEAYHLLMKLYLLEAAYPEALAVLEPMRAHRPDDPYPWLYQGLVYHNLSDAAEAARSFAQARRRMNPAQRAVFSDLSFVLNKAQQQAYAQDPEGYRRAFWATRDARLLTPENERLNEHYARLVYVDLFFGDPWRGTHGWETERGQTFLRYGKPRNFPQAMLRYGPIQSEVFFSGVPHATSRVATWHYEGFALQFEDMMRSGQYIYYDESEILARVLRRDLPERYAHDEPGRRVAFPHLASAFKGEGGEADVYIPYGIPLDGYDPAVPLIDLPLRTGAFLIRPDGTLTSRRQAPQMLSTTQVAAFVEQDLWIDLHHLRARPGLYELSVEFETEARDALGYQRQALRIPDFAADTLMLSDVLLAYGVEESSGPPAPGHLVRDGLSIRPAPWGVFATTQPLYLYAEAYNLARAADGTTAYTVEAAITPWREGGGLKKLLRGVFGRQQPDGVSLRFEATGTSPDAAHYLILDTQDQPPGRYLLALRIHDTVTGERVTSTREVFLE